MIPEIKFFLVKKDRLHEDWKIIYERKLKEFEKEV